jgi:hypothetical protein
MIPPEDSPLHPFKRQEIGIRRFLNETNTKLKTMDKLDQIDDELDDIDKMIHYVEAAIKDPEENVDMEKYELLSARLAHMRKKVSDKQWTIVDKLEEAEEKRKQEEKEKEKEKEKQEEKEIENEDKGKDKDDENSVSNTELSWEKIKPNATREEQNAFTEYMADLFGHLSDPSDAEEVIQTMLYKGGPLMGPKDRPHSKMIQAMKKAKNENGLNNRQLAQYSYSVVLKTRRARLTDEEYNNVISGSYSLDELMEMFNRVEHGMDLF